MDVMNSKEVVTMKQKPTLREVGPFVYNMYREAIDVSWDNHHTELTYRYKENFSFIPEESASLDTETKITTSNLPFWGVNAAVRSMGLKTVVPEILEKEPALNDHISLVFTERTVSEILFGYDDPFLKAMHDHFSNTISPHFDGLMPNHPLAEDVKVMPDTIGTGHPHIRDLHKVKKFRGSETILVANSMGKLVSPWPAPENNIVRGNDGGNFPTPVTPTSSLTFFSSTMFRAVDLQFVEPRIHKNIQVNRFKFPDSMWRNAHEVPENKGYNQFGPSGLFDLSTCLNADMFLSLPRFHGVDPMVRSLIDVDWDEQKNPDFTTYFDVESRTGATMNLYMSSQLNIHMSPQEYAVPAEEDWEDDIDVQYFENLLPHYFPIFWASQHAGINDKDAGDFSAAVKFVEDAKRDGPIIAYVIAGVVGLFAFLITARAQAYKSIYTSSDVAYLGTDDIDSMYRGQESMAGHLEPMKLGTHIQRNSYGTTHNTDRQLSSDVYDPSLDAPGPMRHERIYVAEP